MFAKPIIGIVTRNSISLENHNINIIYNDIVKSIINNGGIPVGITLFSNYKELIDICDGIILQGGINNEAYESFISKYCYEKDIPCLGTCLGMQTIACAMAERKSFEVLTKVLRN